MFSVACIAPPTGSQHVRERKPGQNNDSNNNSDKYNNNNRRTKMKYCEAYTSETAKVRPVRGWGALGGAGWGGGSSWSLSINAPKSSLIAFLSFLVISRIPAKPNPKSTHRLAELEAMETLDAQLRFSKRVLGGDKERR